MRTAREIRADLREVIDDLPLSLPYNATRRLHRLCADLEALHTDPMRASATELYSALCLARPAVDRSAETAHNRALVDVIDGALAKARGEQ